MHRVVPSRRKMILMFAVFLLFLVVGALTIGLGVALDQPGVAAIGALVLVIDMHVWENDRLTRARYHQAKARR